MKNAMVILGITYLLGVSGCATPHVIQAEKTGDNNLNCQQLAQQINEADDFEAKARKEKGVTGTNVAAALLFWPAMIATYQNANEAIDAAQKRKNKLISLYNQKSCK